MEGQADVAGSMMKLRTAITSQLIWYGSMPVRAGALSPLHIPGYRYRVLTRSKGGHRHPSIVTKIVITVPLGPCTVAYDNITMYRMSCAQKRVIQPTVAYIRPTISTLPYLQLVFNSWVHKILNSSLFYLPPPIALVDTAVLFCGTHVDKRSPKTPRPDNQSAVVSSFMLGRLKQGSFTDGEILRSSKVSSTLVCALHSASIHQGGHPPAPNNSPANASRTEAVPTIIQSKRKHGREGDTKREATHEVVMPMAMNVMKMQ
eukprot:scaffold17946_cov73-Attheya_sp.AAC.2